MSLHVSPHWPALLPSGLASRQLAPDLPPSSSTTPPPDQHQQHQLHPPWPPHHGPSDHQQPTPADPATAASSLLPSHCLLGWELWPAACLLAQHLATDTHTRALLLQADAVCELGAGLGLPGIVAALLGARHVALTDLPQALPLLADNVERNGVGRVCSVEQLDWGAWVSGSGSGGPCNSGSKGGTGAEGSGQQEQQQGEGAQHAERVRQRHESSYDVVLAADVVYVSALAPLLADVIAGVLAPGGVAILGHTVRKSVGCQTADRGAARAAGQRTTTVVSELHWGALLAQELTVGAAVPVWVIASAYCHLLLARCCAS